MSTPTKRHKRSKKPKRPPSNPVYPTDKGVQEVNVALALPADDPSLTRVFVRPARLVPFSHRHLCSLRHPRVAEAVAQDMQERGPRDPADEMNRFARMSPHHLAYMQEQADKWGELGAMFDAIAHKEEISQRRTDRMRSWQFLEAVERWWGRMVKHGASIVDYDAYVQLHERWPSHVFPTAHQRGSMSRT